MATAKVLELLLVHPDTVEGVLVRSPRLRGYIEAQQVVIVPVRWAGTVSRMPRGQNFLVHCSDYINGSTFNIIEKCAALRHVLFYNDHLIIHGSRLGPNDLIDAVRSLVARRNNPPFKDAP